MRNEPDGPGIVSSRLRGTRGGEPRRSSPAAWRTRGRPVVCGLGVLTLALGISFGALRSGTDLARADLVPTTSVPSLPPTPTVSVPQVPDPSPVPTVSTPSTPPVPTVSTPSPPPVTPV